MLTKFEFFFFSSRISAVSRFEIVSYVTRGIFFIKLLPFVQLNIHAYENHCLFRKRTLLAFKKSLIIILNTKIIETKTVNPYFQLLDVSVVKKAVCRYGYRWRNSSFCVEGMISLLTFF